MTADPQTLADDDAALVHPFVRTLVSLVRAQDRFGAWERKSDAELLAEFVADKEKRRLIPLMGDPDPDLLARLEWFYTAIGLEVEKRTGIMAAPIMKMSHEGFGRMVMTAGRLVVINRHLRDVHRWGFPTLAKLAEEGEKITADAVLWIAKHRDVAEA